ncbi:MAG: YidC/Oxa1 family membrane protein insertase [Patescibacteria group bacterium]|nr:YidC/Oxa1 family membrane protein insertase [Patescibacteria group bacterium]
MVEIFNTILFEPIFNLLMAIYHNLPPHDLGVSIILVTFILKLILFYPAWYSIKSQQAMQEIQPKLDALRKKYAGNREELSRQLVVFYRENKISPFSSCLPILIQFPILIALYQVFIAVSRTDPATGILAANQLEHLYQPLSDIYANTAINGHFLGFVDLTQTKNYVLAGIAAVLQLWQSRMLMSQQPKKAKSGGMAQNMSRQMMYLMPVITFIFGASFPAGLTLYWGASTAFQIIQQYLFLRWHKKNIANNGTAEQRAN